MGPMNLRRLEYFLAVVDAGTVTAAAEELRVAQPALSRQVRTLERELRLRLFETRGNRLVLTPTGSAFVPMARRLVLHARDTEEAVEALRAGRVERLTCAATAASIRGFVADFIAATGPDDPLITTREAGHFELEDTLLHGVDFIVAPRAPGPGLAREDLGGVPLRALVAPTHPWAGRREPLGWEELVREHLILPSHHSVSRHLVDADLAARSLALGETTECDDGPTVTALAAAGRGVGITTERPGPGVRSTPIADGSLLTLHMAWLRGHHAEPTLRSLAGRMRDRIARWE